MGTPPGKAHYPALWGVEINLFLFGYYKVKNGCTNILTIFDSSHRIVKNLYLNDLNAMTGNRSGIISILKRAFVWWEESRISVS